MLSCSLVNLFRKT